jgi:hypothetical protein
VVLGGGIVFAIIMSSLSGFGTKPPRMKPNLEGYIIPLGFRRRVFGRVCFVINISSFQD